MPNRIIKESICTSDSVDQMTWFEECFWQRLIVNCDDYGRFDARISVLKARLFPPWEQRDKAKAPQKQMVRYIHPDENGNPTEGWREA